MTSLISNGDNISHWFSPKRRIGTSGSLGFPRCHDLGKLQTSLRSDCLHEVTHYKHLHFLHIFPYDFYQAITSEWSDLFGVNGLPWERSPSALNHAYIKVRDATSRLLRHLPRASFSIRDCSWYLHLQWIVSCFVLCLPFRDGFWLPMIRRCLAPRPMHTHSIFT